MRGGDDLKELGFIPRFFQLLEIYNGLRNGDGTLSSPGGADSIIHDPQPIRDRPVGGVGDYFHTVRRGINPGDIDPCLFVRSRVIEVVYMYVWMDYNLGMGPYRLQMTVTLCAIPGQ